MESTRCSRILFSLVWMAGIGLLAETGAWAVSPLHKLRPDSAPEAHWRADRAEIACAGNEWEAAQVVFRSSEQATGLALEWTDFAGPGGATIPRDCLRFRKVEWVDVNAPFDPDEPSLQPDMQPDPLASVDPARDRFRLEADRNLAFWILVGVPADAPAGVYEARIGLRNQDVTVAALPVRLRVWGYSLPRRPILQSLVGISAGNVYKAHGCVSEAEKEAVVRLYFDEYIRARLSPFLYAPGTMAFSPLPKARIEWRFRKGADGEPTGEVELDFSGFDREGTLYLDRRDAFSSFNVAPYLWTRKRDRGVTTISLRVADSAGVVIHRRKEDGTTNPLFDQAVTGIFRGIETHLREKGWLDRAVYYVTDEPAEEECPALKEICMLVRQAAPGLRTALTYDPANRPRLAELVDDAGRSLISLWIPYCTQYSETVAAEQRRKGAEYWLYDVKATCLIPHAGYQNRGVFWTIWANDAKGYLYYLSTYWGREKTPWERPSFLLPNVSYQYRQGDGYFFYPPRRSYNPRPPVLDTAVTSIRWELMRDGAEDYDMLRMLETMIAAARERKLEAATEGEKALAQARSFAASAFGHLGGASIAQLRFDAREEAAGAIPGTGWTFSAKEGWLHHRGGTRHDLPLEFPAQLPDGAYELVVNVYADADYRGRPYSAFLVDGRPLRTPDTALKGAVSVPAGPVRVEGGVCRFVLSAVEGEAGVILYRVGLRRQHAGSGMEIEEIRRRAGEAIERLRTALPAAGR